MIDNAKIQRAMPFIEHMEAHYNRHESPKVFYADLAEAVGEFSAPVLQEAAKRIIRQRVYSRWPSVAECLEAVKVVSREVREAHRTYDNQIPDGNKLRDDEARRMLLCEEGYAAAIEGYHVRLFDHVKRHGRMPNQRELRGIVSAFRAPTIEHKGREFDRRMLWEQQPGEAPWITAARKAMLARREELKQYIMENFRSVDAAE